MTAEETALERKLRYKLGKAGIKLEKTPARSWLREKYGVGYQITRQNRVVLGCSSREYEATLDEVREWVDDHARFFEAA